MFFEILNQKAWKQMRDYTINGITTYSPYNGKFFKRIKYRFKSLDYINYDQEPV